MAKLRYPGDRLNLPDPDQAFRIRVVFAMLESALGDADFSLGLFEDSEREGRSTFAREIIEMPPPHQSRAPFVHARSFIGSLHNIGKFLSVVAKLSGPREGVTAAETCFASTFRDLKGVRDSEQHMEERIQRMAKGRPIETEASFWLGNLIGNRYETTTATGTRGSVEISRRSLESARNCVQDAVDAFEWRGRPHLSRY